MDRRIFGFENATPATDSGGVDRRTSERRVEVRAVKIFLEASGRYVPAMTSNVSEGGALVRLDRAQPLRSGDQVAITIHRDDAGVVSHEHMRQARIVRVTPMDCHHQAVAIRYDQAVESALAA